LPRLWRRVFMAFLVAVAATLAVVATTSLAVAQPAESLEERIARLEQQVAALESTLEDAGTTAGYLGYLRAEANAYRAALEGDRDRFLCLVAIGAVIVAFIIGKDAKSASSLAIRNVNLRRLTYTSMA
jgi:hypothetical protein